MTKGRILIFRVCAALGILMLLIFAAPLYAAPRIKVERLTWRSFMFSVEDSVNATAPLAVLWRWSDGVISGDRRAVHRFSGPGMYSAVVEITDTNGRTTRLEHPVVISFFSPGNWMAWSVVGLCALASLIGMMIARHIRRDAAERGGA